MTYLQTKKHTFAFCGLVMDLSEVRNNQSVMTVPYLNQTSGGLEMPHQRMFPLLTVEF